MRRSGRRRTRSCRRPREPNATTTELAPPGETLRRRRLERGLTLADAAFALRIPVRSLRALEWDRRDLLGSEADRIERRYASYLGLETELYEAEAAPGSPRRPKRPLWVALLAGLAPPLVIALTYAMGEVIGGAGDRDDGGLTFGVVLGLVLLSSLLLVGSVLPPDFVARTPLPSASFGRFRQPLALAGIGILVPVVLFTLLISLT